MESQWWAPSAHPWTWLRAEDANIRPSLCLPDELTQRIFTCKKIIPLRFFFSFCKTVLFLPCPLRIGSISFISFYIHLSAHCSSGILLRARKNHKGKKVNKTIMAAFLFQVTYTTLLQYLAWCSCLINLINPGLLAFLVFFYVFFYCGKIYIT